MTETLPELNGHFGQSGRSFIGVRVFSGFAWPGPQQKVDSSAEGKVPIGQVSKDHPVFNVGTSIFIA